MNNFLLSYNPFSLNPTEAQLLNHVQVNRFVEQYYQPFMGTYILKSQQPIGKLSESMKGFFSGAPYLLTQLYPELAEGVLPSDIWHWINYGYVPPRANQSVLSDLFRNDGNSSG